MTSGKSKHKTIPPAIPTKYTQTFYYSNGLYSRNAAGGSSRDNGTAHGKSTTYTFNFNKDNTSNLGDLTSGYAYSFKEVTPYTGSNFGNLRTSYFDLGTFYVQHYWDMYTFWGQSKAVEASGLFRVRITVKAADGSLLINNKEFSTSAGFGGYWSQSTWSTYYITSYVNFNYILQNNTDFKDKDYVDKSTGRFIISKNGILKIKSITLEFYGETYANSTGSNNCVGDVYISNVYRINGSIANAEKNTYQGSRATSVVYPSINYYKPSKYQTTSNEGGYRYYFEKDGIYVKNNDGDLIGSFKFSGGNLLFNDNQVLIAQQ